MISETHFNVRIKCPPDFTYIARSKKIDSITPRGGVAVFKNNSCDFDIDILCQSLRDCVVCQIKNTDLIFVAAYIPPHNSVYFNDIYFENLKIISENCHHKNEKNITSVFLSNFGRIFSTRL